MPAEGSVASAGVEASNRDVAPFVLASMVPPDDDNAAPFDALSRLGKSCAASFALRLAELLSAPRGLGVIDECPKMHENEKKCSFCNNKRMLLRNQGVVESHTTIGLRFPALEQKKNTPGLKTRCPFGP